MSNENTITQPQNKELFPLGEIVMTIGAKETLEDSNQSPLSFIALHRTGDWGLINQEDWQENEFSLKNGYRLLSAYKTSKGEKLWVITEADRSVTTILLPSEY